MRHRAALLSGLLALLPVGCVGTQAVQTVARCEGLRAAKFHFNVPRARLRVPRPPPLEVLVE